MIVPDAFVPSVMSVPIKRNYAGSSEKVESAVAATDQPETEELTELEGAPVDEGARWPDEISESAFLAEQPTTAAALPIVLELVKPKASGAVTKEPEEPKVTLPALQDLVDRISPETRDVLEDLFRARFVSVKRMPKNALKTV